MLTTNDGTQLLNGRVGPNGPKDNPNNWLDKNSTSYSIQNFKGMFTTLNTIRFTLKEMVNTIPLSTTYLQGFK